MFAIPLWAYAMVVVISLAVILGLLGLVFKMTKPSDEARRLAQQQAALRGLTGKEKRKEKRQAKVSDDEKDEDDEDEEEEEEEAAQPRRRGGGLARMRRRVRPGAAAGRAEEDDDNKPQARANDPHDGGGDDDDDDDGTEGDLDQQQKKKIGVKKMAKLQRKEEAKQARQADEERRAQRKAREEQEEEERLRLKEEEKEREQLEREDEERRQKEREARELEEFNKWKGFMEVEAEGSAKAELEAKRAKLVHFADHVKREKVVLLEDLAVAFSLQTQEVIDELKKAEDEGRLTGVIDERGKYIYISPEEMDSVAKFIKYRGRVSIREIAAESNKLIKMLPSERTDEPVEGSEGEADPAGTQ